MNSIGRRFFFFQTYFHHLEQVQSCLILFLTKNLFLATLTTSQIYLPYGELFYTILETPKTHGYGVKAAPPRAAAAAPPPHSASNTEARRAAYIAWLSSKAQRSLALLLRTAPALSATGRQEAALLLGIAYRHCQQRRTPRHY